MSDLEARLSRLEERMACIEKRLLPNDHELAGLRPEYYLAIQRCARGDKQPLMAFLRKTGGKVPK